MGIVHHVVESQQFSSEFLVALFSLADKMRVSAPRDALSGKILLTLFYEASTRTRVSFESAMLSLGGRVISVPDAQGFSSVVKGETLSDSIMTYCRYVNAIVIRHPDEGAAREAAMNSLVPVINAGDGAGQHPTQALLDIYTIRRHFGSLDGLKLALVGDLRYGRTVHSLAYLLGKFRGVTLYLVSPRGCEIKRDLLDYFSRHGISVIESDDLGRVLPEVDCVYVTRIQKERFKSEADYRTVLDGQFSVNEHNIRLMKDNAILMHPLPRVGEIDPSVDGNHRSVYFSEQLGNGLYIRMALLLMLLDSEYGSRVESLLPFDRNR